MSDPGPLRILEPLIALFYRQPGDLGQFEQVSAEAMPPTYRRLLAHQDHMTVTVERFHQSLVDVRVLDTSINQERYARKILLARQTDGVVVQFGIVRLDFHQVSDAVRREIESQNTPLGRVLINHNVLREIHLMRLWKVIPGPDLCQQFGLSASTPTYGRTARIDCNGQPAIELLEIVTPVEGQASEV